MPIWTFVHFHFQLIESNSTTIEQMENERSGHKALAQSGVKSSIIHMSAYDQGTLVNWSQVMGKNKVLWFVPYIGSYWKPNGDGVVFPKNENDRDLSMIEENNSNTRNSGSNHNISKGNRNNERQDSSHSMLKTKVDISIVGKNPFEPLETGTSSRSPFKLGGFPVDQQGSSASTMVKSSRNESMETTKRDPKPRREDDHQQNARKGRKFPLLTNPFE